MTSSPSKDAALRALQKAIDDLNNPNAPADDERGILLFNANKDNNHHVVVHNYELSCAIEALTYIMHLIILGSKEADEIFIDSMHKAIAMVEYHHAQSSTSH